MAQQAPLRVIAFGAHPDDCDGKFGGTAAKFVKAGAAVKFVSVTNGDAGHQEMGGVALARRRYIETQESARRLGIAEYEVMNNHDGELMPTLEVRLEVIRAIRQWKADIVLSPRPNDYHPDHRYTGVLVQDAAYMVVVPNIVPDVPALRKNPIFLYYDDNFQQPNPFRLGQQDRRYGRPGIADVRVAAVGGRKPRPSPQGRGGPQTVALSIARGTDLPGDPGRAGGALRRRPGREDRTRRSLPVVRVRGAGQY
jgi:LmbE family N-acetylglucosaminyl deacetylase